MYLEILRDLTETRESKKKTLAVDLETKISFLANSYHILTSYPWLEGKLLGNPSVFTGS